MEYIGQINSPTIHVDIYVHVKIRITSICV